MQCYKINSCAFFGHYRERFGEARLQTLIRAYCEGPLQPMCKRLLFIARHDVEPPVDLCPDGFQAGTGNRLIS